MVFVPAPWAANPEEQQPPRLYDPFLEASKIAEKLLERAGIFDTIYYEWGDAGDDNRPQVHTVASYHDLFQFSWETAIKAEPRFEGVPGLKEFFDTLAKYPPGILIDLNLQFGGKDRSGARQIFTREDLVDVYVGTLIHEYGHAIEDFFRVVTPSMEEKLKIYYMNLLEEEKYYAYHRLVWGYTKKKAITARNEIWAEDFRATIQGIDVYYPERPETDLFHLFPTDRKWVEEVIQKYVKMSEVGRP
jgi:hypothetical protein